MVMVSPSSKTPLANDSTSVSVKKCYVHIYYFFCVRSMYKITNLRIRSSCKKTNVIVTTAIALQEKNRKDRVFNWTDNLKTVSESFIFRWLSWWKYNFELVKIKIKSMRPPKRKRAGTLVCFFKLKSIEHLEIDSTDLRQNYFYERLIPSSVLTSSKFHITKRWTGN